MILRLIFTLLCLAAAAWYLDREQNEGTFQKVDSAYLDILLTHASGEPPSGAEKSPVVLVELKEEQRAEYANWPPPPLDWQTLLVALQPYHPEVLAVTTPLNWGRPTPDFAPAVAEALLKFPSVVLGVECQLADGPTSGPAFLGDLDDLLPRFSNVEGALDSVPVLSALIAPPDAAVRSASEMGPLSLRLTKEGWVLPYALKTGDTLIPTLLSQTLTRITRSPYQGGQRFRLGPDAGVYLQEGLYVPLKSSGGQYVVSSADKVPTINALDLMAGDLMDALSDEDKKRLEDAAVIVVGITPQEEELAAAYPARQYAQALNRILSQPRLQKLGLYSQWAVWALAGVISLWMVMKVRRTQVLWVGIGVLLAWAAACYFLFQSRQIWFPPVPPVAFIGLGMLLGRIIGKKGKVAKPSDSPSAVGESADAEKKEEPAADPDKGTKDPAPATTEPEKPSPPANKKTEPESSNKEEPEKGVENKDVPAAKDSEAPATPPNEKEKNVPASADKAPSATPEKKDDSWKQDELPLEKDKAKADEKKEPPTPDKKEKAEAAPAKKDGALAAAPSENVESKPSRRRK